MVDNSLTNDSGNSINDAIKKHQDFIAASIQDSGDITNRVFMLYGMDLSSLDSGVKEIFGALTYQGNVSENRAIFGGRIDDLAYKTSLGTFLTGGYTKSGNAEHNVLAIQNASLKLDVNRVGHHAPLGGHGTYVGGSSYAKGDALANQLVIYNSSIDTSGGGHRGTWYSFNELIGGYAQGGNAERNLVLLDNMSSSPSSLMLSYYDIYGGYSSSGIAKENRVIINEKDIDFQAQNVIGGLSEWGNTEGNEIDFNAGGIATNAKVCRLLNDYVQVYGGWTMMDNGSSTDNIINIGMDDGSSSSLNLAGMQANGGVVGIMPSADTLQNTKGNTLNVYTQAYLGSIGNFENIRLHLNDTIATSTPQNPLTFLTLQDTLNKLQEKRTTIYWPHFTVDGVEVLANAENGKVLHLLSNEAGIRILNDINGKGDGYDHEKYIVRGRDGYEAYAARDSATNPQNIDLWKYSFRGVQNALAQENDKVFAGRSHLGNTTENNSLVLDDQNAAHLQNFTAYAGYTTGQGGDAEHQGDSAENTLLVKEGAKVLKAYGGATEAAKGNAFKNVVHLAGGTVTEDVRGGYADTGNATENAVTITSGTATNVYGGYANTGDATQNTVTITGGTMQDVYGGYSPTGQTTGNIVNLGDAQGNFTAQVGTIYGGNQGAGTNGNGLQESDANNAKIRGNVLNLNGNAALGNIKNFESLHFNFDHLVPDKPLLELGKGNQEKTQLRWFLKKSPVVHLPTHNHPDGEDVIQWEEDWKPILTQGPARAEKMIILENKNGLDCQGTYLYPAQIATDGYNEYTLKVDDKNKPTQILYAGYTFKNSQPQIPYIDQKTNTAYAGRSIIGNTTTGNVLTIDDAHGNYTAAYGGWTAGTGTTAKGTEQNDSTGNIVNVYGGTVQDVYGGYTEANGQTIHNVVNLGNASLPKVDIPQTTLHGGNRGATGNVLHVYSQTTAKNIDGASFDKIIFDLSNLNPTETTTPRLTLNDTQGTKIPSLHMLDVDGATKDAVLMQNNAGITLTDAHAAQYITKITHTDAKDMRGNLITDAWGKPLQTYREFDITTASNGLHPITEILCQGYNYENSYQPATESVQVQGQTQFNVWAARSNMGITTRNSHLILDDPKVTYRNAYGGWTNDKSSGKAEIAPTSRPQDYTTYNSVDNSLAIGAVHVTNNVYGGYTNIVDGKAEGNLVILQGGTVDGNVYGGYAEGTGAANRNAVTLVRGKVKGDVYGGWGTDTAGNVINLGRLRRPIRANNFFVMPPPATQPPAINMTVDGMIYGANHKGNNTLRLNANGTRGLAKGLENIQNIRFSLDDGVLDKRTGDSLLRLSQSTDLGNADIRADEKTTNAFKQWLKSTDMQKTASLISVQGDAHQDAMQRSAHLDWKSSNPIPRHIGDLEYTLALDDAKKSLDVTVYHYQNADVTVKDGDQKQVYGGKTQPDAKNADGTDTGTKNNHLTIDKGADVNQAIAGNTQTEHGTSTQNEVTVKDGKADVVIGGQTKQGVANDNRVNIQGGEVNTVKGAKTDGEAHGNQVNITGGNVTGDVIGADTKGRAQNNTVIIDGTKVQGNVTATTGQSAGGNDVALKNDAKVHDVQGDSITLEHAQAGNVHANNTANIRNDSLVTGNIYAGIVQVDDSTVNGAIKGNTVTIHHATIGGTIDADTVHVYSGSGNSSVQDIHAPKLLFHIENNVDTTKPLLRLNDTSKSPQKYTIGVHMTGDAPLLQRNDVLHLLKGGTTDSVIQKNVPGSQGVSLRYDFDLAKREDEIIAKVTDVHMKAQTKSLVETRAGMSDFINRSADILASTGMRLAEQAAQKEKDYNLWATMSHSDQSNRTGSAIETKGWHLALGWARKDKRGETTRTYGPFFEYGKGSYHSSIAENVSGSGKLSYIGAGYLFRANRQKGSYLELGLHGGKARSDYTGSLDQRTETHYDASNAYLAAHLGLGKHYDLHAGDTLDSYLTYFWSHQAHMQTHLNSGELYDFEAVNSHRLRLGTRYTHELNAENIFYTGLAFEYEFAGRATASYAGYSAPSPSLRGGSELVEMGYRFQPKNSRFSCDLNLTAWQGKREGFMGSAHFNWAFA